MDEQLKNNKTGIFKLPDLIIYGIVVLLVSSLFLIPLLNKSSGDFNGFDVYKNGEIIFSLSFDDKYAYSVNENSKDLVEVSYGDNKVTVKIFTDENKKDYNLISCDLQEKSVCVVDSTCSVRKDCVSFKPIVDNSGVIICQPHGLKILPKGKRYVPVVTG